jgi:hypothetical protein
LSGVHPMALRIVVIGDSFRIPQWVKMSQSTLYGAADSFTAARWQS